MILRGHAFLYLNVYEMSQFPSKQSRPRPLPPKRKCYPVCGCVFRILNNWVSGVSILLDLCVSECATLVLCVCVYSPNPHAARWHNTAGS